MFAKHSMSEYAMRNCQKFYELYSAYSCSHNFIYQKNGILVFDPFFTCSKVRFCILPLCR